MSQIQQFCEDISKIDLNDPDAKNLMMQKIKQYDDNFQQKNYQPTPQQLSGIYKNEQIKLQLPKKGSEVEKQLKTQFIADGSIFGEYQTILRQAQVPAYVIPPPPPPKPEEQLANVFLRLPYNYLDQNANSKNELLNPQKLPNYQNNNNNNNLQFSNFLSTIQAQNPQQQLIQSPQIQSEINNINPAAQQASQINHQQTVNLQMQTNDTPTGVDSDFLTNIKKTVNVLGGIEDTVQVMKQSLQDYELQNQVNSKLESQPIFKNSTLMNQTKVQQNTLQFHPFQKFIQTESLKVVQESQKLRQQKQQQTIHY